MSSSYILNTTTSSINVHLNSADALGLIGVGADSGLPNTSDFVFNFEDYIFCSLSQNMVVSIDSAEIPCSWYNVSLAVENSKFSFQETGHAAGVITLTSGCYDVDDLADEIGTKLTAYSVGKLGSTYTVEYENKTLKFKITSTDTSTVYILDFTDYYYTSRLLGFASSSYNSSSGIRIGLRPANMNSIPFVFLDTSFGQSGSIISNSRSDAQPYNSFQSSVLAKIQVDKLPSEIIHYFPHGNKHNLVLQRKRISQLRFTLRDQYYRVLDMNGVGFSLTLSIDFVDFSSEGLYDNNPEELKKPETRESVSDTLTQMFIKQGMEIQKGVKQRNQLINLLDLDTPT
jgi:hypothetical protein